MPERLNIASVPALLLSVALAAGCQSAVQQPTSTTPTGGANNPTQQTGGSAPGTNQPSRSQSNRATQHVLESMAMGAQWGGLLAGPFAQFGALGGLVVGAIYGMVTVGQEEERVVAQINKEAQKDQQLEALIEQELERQRALDGQIQTASAQTTGSSSATTSTAGSTAPAPTTTTSKNPQPPDRPSPPPSRTRDNVAVASVNKPVPPPAPPAPFKNVEVRDINGDGVPDLWIYYNPQKPGEIIRQEESTKGDGRVDTWSYFKDGKLLRREVDTSGEGRPNTVYYYSEDKIVREERDEFGQGRMTYRANYENGHLAKVERDSTGRGRSDLWIYYDPTQDNEIIVKEERDLNGDGIVDIWTYHENGRVVRRDVSATGLEILAKEEQPQVPVADLRAVSLPGR
jgi:hypothetical protein